MGFWHGASGAKGSHAVSILRCRPSGLGLLSRRLPRALILDSLRGSSGVTFICRAAIQASMSARRKRQSEPRWKPGNFRRYKNAVDGARVAVQVRRNLPKVHDVAGFRLWWFRC
jgi:hypothetical protein